MTHATDYINSHESIAFNLILVKNDARQAYLIESADYDDIKFSTLLHGIAQLYPHFKQTVELMVDGKPFRVMIHKNKLLRKKAGENDDMWIAKVLGFDCHGLPDKTATRYISEYYIGNVQFYAEICRYKKNIKSKRRLFQQFTSEKIILTIVKKEADNIFIKRLAKKDLSYLTRNRSDLHMHIIGSGGYIRGDMDKLIRDNFDWFVYAVVRSFYNPFANLMYPVSVADSELLMKNMKRMWLSKRGPVIAYKRFENTDLFARLSTGDYDQYLADTDKLNAIYTKIMLKYQ